MSFNFDFKANGARRHEPEFERLADTEKGEKIIWVF